MAIKVGINGFGRIGRNIMRAAMGDDDIDIVAVNDLTDAATLAHLLKYDSILGNLKADITADGDRITVDGDEFQVLSLRRIRRSCRGRTSASTSCSSRTGLFTNRDDAAKHLAAGAKQVIITAPAKKPDVTVVMGVNHDELRPGEAPHHLERVVHDQLPGAGRQGAARDVRHQEGLDDDRATPTRTTSSCSTCRTRTCGARARRRCRSSRRRPARRRRSAKCCRRSRASSTASRCACRRRTSRSSTSTAVLEQDGDGRGGQRGVQGGRRRPAQGHPRVRRRRRSCRSTSAATRTRRSSTRRTRRSWTATS